MHACMNCRHIHGYNIIISSCIANLENFIIYPGKTISTGSGGHVHVYPFNPNNAHGPPRTAKNYKQSCMDAFSTSQTVRKRHNIIITEADLWFVNTGFIIHTYNFVFYVLQVFGVKGPTLVMELSQFDIIRGTSIDYMHQSVLGVGRQLLKLWFQTKHHRNLWDIGRELKEVDFKLLSICPTMEMQRLSRSIYDTMKFWKGSINFIMFTSCIFTYHKLYTNIYYRIIIAHEVRAWLLYYSLPVLQNILPKEYIEHHVALISGLCHVLKDSVEESNLKEAQICLEYYCSVFSDLYSKFLIDFSCIFENFDHFYYYLPYCILCTGHHQMTINVHSLLHLCENVRNLGPLWCHACFHLKT